MKLIPFFLFFSFWILEAKAYDIVVAKDGSGDVSTVQAAFDKAPANSAIRFVIFVKKGIYKEKVKLISSKKNISLIGEDKITTVLTFDDYGDKPGVGGTDNSYSTLIEANDFYSENICYENTIDSRLSAYATGGQAVALMLKGDRTILNNCIIRGFQDTFYTKGTGRTFLQCCRIEGTTDFIFGAGIAIFQSCVIVNKKNSHTTAAANISAANKFNYVFFDCKLIAAEGTNSATLGRPWKTYAKVVYIRCEEGSHITASGWSDWSSESHSSTAYFAEYNCTGAGYKPAARISWSHQLTAAEAAQYTFQTIFSQNAATPSYSASWIPDLSISNCSDVISGISNDTNQLLPEFIFTNLPEGKVGISVIGEVQAAQLNIYNVHGKLVMVEELDKQSENKNFNFYKNNNGIYFYQVISGAKIFAGKFFYNGNSE